MSLRIIDHAKERMQTYGISEAQVKDAVLKPDSAAISYKGRKIAQKRLNSYVLRGYIRGNWK
ncbi:MAG: DUF4258 domain-containing protein [Candidatus Diapherotrites archaeon]|nr:DUF4258 domain-containing protein [Candidatus Micrarchaeota archaeon]MBU1939380.1 DUF4258 domain-containing protein [Candidatus Micrarchaeota archaeon]